MEEIKAGTVVLVRSPEGVFIGTTTGGVTESIVKVRREDSEDVEDAQREDIQVFDATPETPTGKLVLLYGEMNILYGMATQKAISTSVTKEREAYEAAKKSAYTYSIAAGRVGAELRARVARLPF